MSVFLSGHIAIGQYVRDNYKKCLNTRYAELINICGDMVLKYKDKVKAIVTRDGKRTFLIKPEDTFIADEVVSLLKKKFFNLDKGSDSGMVPVFKTLKDKYKLAAGSACRKFERARSFVYDYVALLDYALVIRRNVVVVPKEKIKEVIYLYEKSIDTEAKNQEVMPRPQQKIAVLTKDEENVVRGAHDTVDGWSDHTAEFLMKKFSEFIEEMNKIEALKPAALAGRKHLDAMLANIKLAKVNTKVGVKIDD